MINQQKAVVKANFRSNNIVLIVMRGFFHIMLLQCQYSTYVSVDDQLSFSYFRSSGRQQCLQFP